MGNIINPISIRLTQNISWKSNWVSFSDKSNLNFDDFFFNKLINWYFYQNKFLTKIDLLYSHYYIKKFKNNIEITFILNTNAVEFNFFKQFQIYFLKRRSLILKKIFYNLHKKLGKNFLNIVTTSENNSWKFKEIYSFLGILLKHEKLLNNRFPKKFKFLKYKLPKSNIMLYCYILYKFYLNKLLYENFLNYISLILKQNFLWYINSIKLKKHINIKLNFNYINSLTINSNLILKYLIIRLKQRVNLNELIYPLFKLLKKNKSIIGIKIGCFGRFSRKQRATRIWYTYGKVPLNTLTIPIDYSMSSIKLKNSLCGLKIFVAYDFNNLKTINEKNLLNFHNNDFSQNLKFTFYKNYLINYYLKFFKKILIKEYARLDRY